MVPTRPARCLVFSTAIESAVPLCVYRCRLCRCPIPLCGAPCHGSFYHRISSAMWGPEEALTHALINGHILLPSVPLACRWQGRKLLAGGLAESASLYGKKRWESWLFVRDDMLSRRRQNAGPAGRYAGDVCHNRRTTLTNSDIAVMPRTNILHTMAVASRRYRGTHPDRPLRGVLGGLLRERSRWKVSHTR